MLLQESLAEIQNEHPLLLLSGGVDSTTIFFNMIYKQIDFDVVTISFDQTSPDYCIVEQLLQYAK